MAARFVFLSLPLDAFDSSDKDEALSALKSVISDSGSVLPYNIPNFKIGTLDALVQQADDLAKMEATCAGVVSKVSDSLKSLVGGDEDKMAQHKKVNDSTCGRRLLPLPFVWAQGMGTHGLTLTSASE